MLKKQNKNTQKPHAFDLLAVHARGGATLIEIPRGAPAFVQSCGGTGNYVIRTATN